MKRYTLGFFSCLILLGGCATELPIAENSASEGDSSVTTPVLPKVSQTPGNALPSGLIVPTPLPAKIEKLKLGAFPSSLQIGSAPIQLEAEVVWSNGDTDQKVEWQLEETEFARLEAGQLVPQQPGRVKLTVTSTEEPSLTQDVYIKIQAPQIAPPQNQSITEQSLVQAQAAAASKSVPVSVSQPPSLDDPEPQGEVIAGASVASYFPEPAVGQSWTYFVDAAYWYGSNKSYTDSGQATQKITKIEGNNLTLQISNELGATTQQKTKAQFTELSETTSNGESIQYTYEGQETITIRAGTYEAHKVVGVLESELFDIYTTLWMVEGIGYVKQDIQTLFHSLRMRVDSSVELVSFASD